jgi:hypothetical protein
MNLQEMKDMLAKETFGMTTKEAQDKGVCVSCKQVPTHESTLDLNEYRISGLCGACFDEATYAADSEMYDYDEGDIPW